MALQVKSVSSFMPHRPTAPFRNEGADLIHDLSRGPPLGSESAHKFTPRSHILPSPSGRSATVRLFEFSASPLDVHRHPEGGDVVRMTLEGKKCSGVGLFFPITRCTFSGHLDSRNTGRSVVVVPAVSLPVSLAEPAFYVLTWTLHGTPQSLNIGHKWT